MSKKNLRNLENEQKIKILKEIAFLRHTQTRYDKNLRVMYDKNGNQTEIRKAINHILYLIVTKQIPYSYIGSIRNEIAYGTQKLAKKKKQKTLSPEKEQQKTQKAFNALQRGVNKMYQKQENVSFSEDEERHVHIIYRNIMLKPIGLNSRTLSRRSKNLLPKPSDYPEERS